LIEVWPAGAPRIGERLALRRIPQRGVAVFDRHHFSGTPFLESVVSQVSHSSFPFRCATPTGLEADFAWGVDAQAAPRGRVYAERRSAHETNWSPAQRPIFRCRP